MVSSYLLILCRWSSTVSHSKDNRVHYTSISSFALGTGSICCELDHLVKKDSLSRYLGRNNLVRDNRLRYSSCRLGWLAFVQERLIDSLYCTLYSTRFLTNNNAEKYEKLESICSDKDVTTMLISTDVKRYNDSKLLFGPNFKTIAPWYYYNW